jgi:uncharacterized protein (PEP-CTERM system associated)
MHNNNRQGKGEGVGKVSAAAGAALGAIIVGAAAPAQASVEFTPTIEVGATWTDNIELAPRIQSEQTEYVAEVMPGFELRQEGRRLKSSLNYSLRSFFYEKDSDRDTSFHDAGASLNAEVIRNLFFIEAQGAYKQQIIDPTRPVNNNFLFAVDNLTDAISGSVTPRLRREFDLLQVDASYTAGFIDYKQTGDIATLTSDADTQEQRISLASPDDDRFISWGAEYTRQSTEFDDVQVMGVQRFEFEQASAEIGIRLIDELRLIGRGGKESDVEENSTDGGLDETTWEAGLAYSPTPGTKFEAFYGKRFFGTTYRASARREAQFLQLSASYDEGPVTQAQQLLSQAQTGSPVTPIAPLDPGTNPIGTLTSDVFIAKNFDLTIGLTGRLTKVNVSGLNQRREYLVSRQDERVTGARATVIRNLSARTDATVDIFYTDTMFRSGDAFNERSLRFGLTRTLSERISANAMIGRVTRSGTFGYTANWINVGLKASF